MCCPLDNSFVAGLLCIIMKAVQALNLTVHAAEFLCWTGPQQGTGGSRGSPVCLLQRAHPCHLSTCPIAHALQLLRGYNLSI